MSKPFERHIVPFRRLGSVQNKKAQPKIEPEQLRWMVPINWLGMAPQAFYCIMTETIKEINEPSF